MSGLTVPGIPEAPANGSQYVRNNAAWQRTFISDGYVSTHWYPADYGLSVQAGTTLGVNTIIFSPFVIYADVTITDLMAEVTTAVAASNFQIAIYASDPTTKLPIGAALTSTANMSAATTTTVSSTLASPVTLLAGLYWSAINNDTSAIGFRTGSASQAWASAYVGATTMARAMSANPGRLYYTLAQTFGTWPTVVTVTEASTSTFNQIICYKAQ